LLERVIWVAKECRPFIDTGVYLGPDRRFRDDEVEAAQARRRSDPPKPATHTDGMEETPADEADSADFKDAAA
jgi:hypothetical protein